VHLFGWCTEAGDVRGHKDHALYRGWRWEYKVKGNQTELFRYSISLTNRWNTPCASLCGHNICLVSRLTDSTCPSRVWRRFESPTDTQPVYAGLAPGSKVYIACQRHFLRELESYPSMFRGLGFSQRAEKDTNLLGRRLAELHIGGIPHSVMFQANRNLQWGTRWRSWLGHCATTRKVASSISDGVIGIFHWHYPSGRTISPGVDSVSNRNEYQEYFLGVKAAGA
jgi:hypothetical protein